MKLANWISRFQDQPKWRRIVEKTKTFQGKVLVLSEEVEREERK